MPQPTRDGQKLRAVGSLGGRQEYQYKFEVIQQTTPIQLMAAEVNHKAQGGWRVVVPIGMPNGLLILFEREVASEES